MAEGQPYEYRRRPLTEPDWTRFPGWRGVTREEWVVLPGNGYCARKSRSLIVSLAVPLVDQRRDLRRAPGFFGALVEMLVGLHEAGQDFGGGLE